MSPERSLSTRVRWTVRCAFGACIAFTFLIGLLNLDSPGRILCRAMVNNTFLAYIPVEISLHLADCRSRIMRGICIAAWLLFYSNAPYMLTDFFHLAMFDPYIVLESGKRTSLLRNDLRLWLPFAALTMTALVGALFGTWSLNRVIGALLVRVRNAGVCLRAALALGFASLASVGIYLGRFPRLHSVHVLTQPRHTLDQVSSSIGPDLLEFAVLLTCVQMTLWLWLEFSRLESAPAASGSPQ